MTRIIEEVCTKALHDIQRWENYIVEKFARKFYLILNVLDIDEYCEEVLKTQMQSSSIKRTCVIEFNLEKDYWKLTSISRARLQ